MTVPKRFQHLSHNRPFGQHQSRSPLSSSFPRNFGRNMTMMDRYNRDDRFNRDDSFINRFNRDGYNRDGFNRDGFNRDGYNREGYNREGINRDSSYSRDGFNRDGYNRDGYNRDGYNREGFNRDNFHRDGYSRDNHHRYKSDSTSRVRSDGFDDSRSPTRYNQSSFNQSGYNQQQSYGSSSYGGMNPLTVQMTEFYPKDNARDSHTEQYDLVNQADQPTPVLRRGEKFFFAIRFDRDFDQKTDVVRVCFNFGNKPNVTKGTRVILPLLAQQRSSGSFTSGLWSLNVHRVDGNTVTLQVRIAPTAPVGIWHCNVQTNISGHRGQRYDYKCDDDIYILFNPWCKEDLVYMEGEAEKREYITNETGKIWCGSFKQPKGRRWVFGQFDDIILPAACYLLEQSGLNHTDRGSPIQVVRAISAIVNSLDDNGLLEGRWDGDYKDGTSPHAWTGSVAIMEQYLSSGGQPVKYGQCWVFSGVTVSICRALGIPCRSVTNYVSAHDTNRSLTVDKYFDKDGNEIPNGPEGDCNDSCWNFHVWNDVWMARPDLPKGYGGWQIIDATPQEESDNIMRCGPASVEAVRRGEVGFLYDTPFVFSEVNADICHLQEDEQSDWGFSRLAINQYHVGRKIVTKRIDRDDDEGNADLWDVTLDYKNPEGSEAERLAVFNAVRGVPKAQQYYDMHRSRGEEDVFFDLVDIDTVPYGQSFDVTVNIHNKSNETRNISAMLSASSVYYTGATAHRIKRSQGTFSIRPGQRETLKIHVTPKEYMEKLVDHNLVKIYAIANVKETKQTWSEEDDFPFQKPKMSIQTQGYPRVGQDCHVNFSFQNPLAVPLKECSYTIEGPGLQKPKIVKYRDVKPGEFVQFSENFTPRLQGERKIVCTFSSREMQEVSGSHNIHVAN